MDAKRPVVYICSKFRGDIEANTEMARRYCRYAISPARETGCMRGWEIWLQR